MTSLTTPEIRAENRRFWRRVAIAPLCLVLVAGLHAARVAAVGQTPWKGGGFGMFSTVDSERARFVRAYAVTPDGDLPLVIPDRWHHRARQLQAAPTCAAAKELAVRLAELAWQTPTQPLVGDRRLEAIGPDKPQDQVVPMWEVRVECWRVRFDRISAMLSAEKVIEASSRKATEGVPHSASFPNPEPRTLSPQSPVPSPLASTP